MQLYNRKVSSIQSTESLRLFANLNKNQNFELGVQCCPFSFLLSIIEVAGDDLARIFGFKVQLLL
jgi:hypothetical protein